MFEMSVKLVPGWSVLIEPRLIGVPVATTPGLVPHDVVETVPVLAGLDAEDAAALLAAALDVAGADEELLEDELELQPAMTPIATTATVAAAVRVRRWNGLFMCSAFSWLTAS